MGLDKTVIGNELDRRMKALDHHFNGLIQHTKAMQDAEVVVSTAKAALAAAEHAVILEFKDNPKDLGANEEARKAGIAQRTYAFTQPLAEAEEVLRIARNNVRLSEIECDLARRQASITQSVAAMAAAI